MSDDRDRIAAVGGAKSRHGFSGNRQIGADRSEPMGAPRGYNAEPGLKWKQQRRKEGKKQRKEE
jgi:hypothetical protein